MSLQEVVNRSLWKDALITFKAKRQTKPLGVPFSRCGECHMMVTAEVQKGHIYYRCTRKSKKVKCSQPFVRQEELERQLGGLLTTFALRHDWADEMLKLVDAERKESTESANAMAERKSAEVAVIAGKVQKLLEAYLDGLIDRDVFTERKCTFMEEKKALQEQIEACEEDSIGWLEPFRKWIVTAKTLGEITQSGSLHEKKALAQEVFGSNLFLDSKKARGSASKPWSLIHETSLAGGMVPRLGLEPRTN